ncbi:MAG: hypothetical protein Q4G00_08940 [Clostridia bacterium]|nr:hypothetical protein [Clostridia bacterium]
MRSSFFYLPPFRKLVGINDSPEDHQALIQKTAETSPPVALPSGAGIFFFLILHGIDQLKLKIVSEEAFVLKKRGRSSDRHHRIIREPISALSGTLLCKQWKML